MKKVGIIIIGVKRYKEIISERFKKNLKRFVDIEEFYIKTANLPEKEELLYEERQILKICKDSKFITFSPDGKLLSKEQFYIKILEFIENNKGFSYFIIGGKYGLSENLKKRSYLNISISPLEFGHLIFKVIFYEQLYRVFAYKYNLPYIQ